MSYTMRCANEENGDAQDHDDDYGGGGRRSAAGTASDEYFDAVDNDPILVSVPLDTAGVSLPHSEELKVISGGVSTSSSNGSGGRHFSPKTLFRQGGGRPRYCAVAIALVVLVVILAVSIPLAHNNNNNSSGNSSKSGSSGGQHRNATTAQIVEFLQAQGVYLDAKAIIGTTGNVSNPQYKAVVWLAEQDAADLRVPSATATSSTPASNNDDAAYAYLVRYILAVCYFSLGGPDIWAPTKLGFLGNRTVCFWKGTVAVTGGLLNGGVRCDKDEGPPLELNLGLVKATGKIPTEIGLLTSLTRLDIRTSLLTGTIPTELCNLRNLEQLFLSENDLTGIIPPCLGSLTALKYLYLNSNLLAGSIPTQASALTNLERLILEVNVLTGNPITTWNNLTKLQWLYASRNNFTGTIDVKFLHGHQGLVNLDVSNNNFTLSTAGLPMHLFSMRNLVNLDLSDNPLHGTIPNATFSATKPNKKLEFLSLHNTEMKGELPSLNHLVALQHLDISTNSFNGAMRNDYGNMTNLELLFLSDNPRLSMGTIPESYAKLSKLRDLSLRNTHRIGAIPTFVGSNLSQLVLLDFGSNELNNTIPADIRKLARLEYLLLNGNPITGGIDALKSLLSHLKVLLLDGTKLSFTYQCPTKTSTQEKLLIYADCFSENPEVNCSDCCHCCYKGDVEGCSKPQLANVDASWKNTFNRSVYKLYDDPINPIPIP